MVELWANGQLQRNQRTLEGKPNSGRPTSGKALGETANLMVGKKRTLGEMANFSGKRRT